jgi:4-hydroxybenzoyl-CoA thioesterase
MLIYVRNTRIEWGDCDPAGIVFYPRYFEMFDAATAALFERALGMTKRQYQVAFDFIGFPMVDTRARFSVPTRFGDDVVIETTVATINRSSFEVRHRLSKDGALAVEGFETRVWSGRDPTDPDRIKSKPIPDEVRARLAAG